jgi:hypothetical protein
MHPDFLGALAAQRMKELTAPAEFRHSEFRRAKRRLGASDRTVGAGAMRRARWHLGAALLDLGLHLLASTSTTTGRAETWPAP